MTCRGCRGAIPDDYRARTFVVERVVFCSAACFDRNAGRLLRLFIPVMRHVAVRHRGKSASLMSLALNSDTPVELL